MVKQSIFGRIAQLAKANINALIDAAEDPQKMLDQMVRDYTNNIVEAEAAVAQTIGNLRLLEQDHAEDLRDADEWGSKALAASNKADEFRAAGDTANADKFDNLAKIALGKQMQAERNKRATILTSEGQKQSAILQSEGEKQAAINRAEANKQQQILIAEGEAQARIRKAEAEAIAIQKITDAVGKSTNPANYLIAQKYIQMLTELAQNNNQKTVYLPFEASNLMGSIGGIKDMFK